MSPSTQIFVLVSVVCFWFGVGVVVGRILTLNSGRKVTSTELDRLVALLPHIEAISLNTGRELGSIEERERVLTEKIVALEQSTRFLDKSASVDALNKHVSKVEAERRMDKIGDTLFANCTVLIDGSEGEVSVCTSDGYPIVRVKNMSRAELDALKLYHVHGPVEVRVA